MNKITLLLEEFKMNKFASDNPWMVFWLIVIALFMADSIIEHIARIFY